jgi:hypothetical protein
MRKVYKTEEGVFFHALSRDFIHSKVVAEYDPAVHSFEASMRIFSIDVKGNVYFEDMDTKGKYSTTSKIFLSFIRRCSLVDGMIFGRWNWVILADRVALNLVEQLED